MPTRRECVERAGRALAAGLVAAESMTPRELAERCWTPTSTKSVDELEDEIREERGMAPIHGGGSSGGGDRGESPSR